MPTLIGSAPNQVPTNADLGGMAYQSPDRVVITGGNVRPANFSTSNAWIGGGYIYNLANLTVEGNTVVNDGKLTVSGNTDTGGFNFVVSKTMTGTVAPGFLNMAWSIVNAANVAPDVTDVAIGFYNQFALDPGTALNGYTHYNAVDQSLIGAGASVQSQTGFATTLSSASANTGFYSLISAGAGNYALKMDGNAQSYLGGDLTVEGNLIVNGTQTTVNSTVLTVDDLNITVASGAASAAAADGAGLTVDGAAATILYTNATDSWNFNKQIISGDLLSTVGNIVTLVATNFSSANAHITGSDSAVGIAHSGVVSAVGNVFSTYGTFTNFGTGNAQITGGSITGVTGAATTLVATNFTSSNAHITGSDTNVGANHDNSLSRINAIYSTYGDITNFATGNAQITGGTLSGLTSVGATTLYATNISSGNIITANAAASTNSNAVATTAFVHSEGGFTSQVVFATAAVSQTWTIPAGTVKLKITVVGGGGGGGGSAAAIGAAGAGGGSGAMGSYYFTGLTPGTNVTYSVGNGGTATVNTVGGGGGASNASVGGVTISAPGGTGGAVGAAVNLPYQGGAGGTIATQSGGTATAFYARPGQDGGNSWGTAAATTCVGGAGAVGYEGGGGGRGKIGAAAGNAGANGTGGGGGGANSQTAATNAGYVGGAGAVIIEY